MRMHLFAGTGVAAAIVVAFLVAPAASAQQSASVRVAVASETGENSQVEPRTECKYRVTAVKLSVRYTPGGKPKGYFYKDNIVTGTFGEDVKGYKEVVKSTGGLSGWVDIDHLDNTDACW